MKIHLLSLNWNTAKLMKQMMASAIKFKETPDQDFYIHIVDNGSNNNEALTITKDYFEIKNKNDETNFSIQPLSENIGFSAGNNVGLREIEAMNPEEDDLVVFINSDIEITEQGWDTKFIKIFEDRKVGVAGCAYHPLVWSRDGRFKIQPIPKEPVESEGVQGAFFAVPWGVLRLIKRNDMWFQESYKLAQYEEIDMMLTIIDELYLKCIYFPLKHLHHHNNSATKANGYKLSKDIQNINDFKANAERNRRLLMKNHPKRFDT